MSRTPFPPEEIHEVIKQLPVNQAEPNFISPLYYISDHGEQTYIYIDRVSEILFSNSHRLTSANGVEYFRSLWHPNDLKVFNGNILPHIMEVLENNPASEYQNFLFTFNYRIKIKSGTYISVLQRSTFTPSSAGAFIEAGFIIDISSYKNDTRIIHKTEKVCGEDILPVPYLTLVYNPDKIQGVLSKREIEILENIYEGLSSKQIADRHSISINTINNHRKNMMQKTHTSNSSGLLKYAIEQGIL